MTCDFCGAAIDATAEPAWSLIAWEVGALPAIGQPVQTFVLSLHHNCAATWRQALPRGRRPPTQGGPTHGPT